ncbi:ATP-dependent RNA helicase DOB1 [Marchantia polymorpha subsp. ruderalis]|uniref:Uncharacterized protein n=2 Tax=Marchantia polymorpha TaxID=3197 RepID=A0A176WJL1_MARPO|nr:hypothetical protein AXG93_4123s1120 [Marchantia polymorpha subsp. ruderalis]PTQ32625.1 hypothetical protein MARPO_0097s0084 [Marchantia polymorpha]PTQ32626.1 hypothetical protein MARPO_0097s0084 [Marchantia polymorpha]BBN13684.1 hypothetical protein Mp_6g05580 [Marchantia polymorpha subsp. ruderalis]BBN13685.1 hypothetical protein Mp_6g05580 [Marchantia polymorpha subsp. ruderalis]|eukprot:PTQ32625.1 hypothetical protein MARPO_0097s0084 [Marchantia polymorpha]
MASGKRKIENGADAMSSPLKQARADSSAAAELKTADELSAPLVDGAGGDSITCLHEVSYPENYEMPEKAEPLLNKKPAKEYPFTLDPFQREAIKCLEAGESVLVSAHTSAGKTVVAEYAIAMSLRDKQRVVYTSPIKALSNQKFREMTEEFSDVGLMTGDVTIAPNASCLVMTTEILRSMQYRGSEVMREVAWIIFDEVHYMRDRERGVVWEESIVMAPKNARFVFLSATVPNAREFSEWVAKVHKQPCHIVYTDYRPTPLQHYVFPMGGDGLYLVVDEKSTFREDSFQKAVNAVSETPNKETGKWQKGPTRGKETAGPSDIFKIVKMIMQRQYDPVIVFSFSKRDCEVQAMQMEKLDLNNDDEKKLVDQIFWSAMDCLSEDDKKLPQVSKLLPWLKQGIGVHHSGLLPILKEVIEILFQEGLVKCLFATETFSIGLNMPAKTVVFTGVRKFDGDKFRWLSGGEYIQMSGRAGRRGLDDRGICILMLDEKLEPPVAKAMVKGSADPLNSAFHLSYNMLINQMRSEESDPEALLRQSFFQFQADRALPKLEKRLKELEEERNSLVIEGEEELKSYFALIEQWREMKSSIRDIAFAPRYALPFLQPGRIVRVLSDEDNDDEELSIGTTIKGYWGVIVNFEKVATATKDFVEEEDGRSAPEPKYMVDVLINSVTKDENSRRKTARPVAMDSPGEPVVTAVPLSQLESLSAVRIYIPKDLRPIEAREKCKKTVLEVLRRFPDGIQLLDPEDDMQVDSKAYKKVTRRLEAVEKMIADHPVASSPSITSRLKILQKKNKLTLSIRAARTEVRAASTLVFKDELKSRRRVLRKLGYATVDGVVEMKGRVACEISSADEIVLTELIFGGNFKELSSEQLVAVLSCFVWQEKSKNAPKLREDLSGPYTQLRDVARRVGKAQLDSKMSIDVELYVTSFRPDIMEVAYAWASGAKFSEIMKMTDTFEGSLIRAFKRLEEVLQQLIVASRSIGATELETKFEDAVVKIKRDIVFAASLYL